MLNVLFDYAKSDYIVNKVHPQEIIARDVGACFMRQNLLFASMSNDTVKVISGEGDPYPMSSATNQERAQNFIHMRLDTNVNRKDALMEAVKKLGDPALDKAIESGDLHGLSSGGLAMKRINGQTSSLDIDTYSSGENEILFRIKFLMERLEADTDLILVDEPETSLHPRWQKLIIPLIRDLARAKNRSEPSQLFVATHSDKVLESVVGDSDVLVVFCERDNEGFHIRCEPELRLYLPMKTYAELNYVAFHIPSLEYHDALFNYFGEMNGTSSVTNIDKKIMNSGVYKRLSPKEMIWEWYDSKNGITYSTHTWPGYIRNHFHHPHSDRRGPTAEELDDSIRLLQQIIASKRK